MTEFERIIKDFLSNAFKEKVVTGLEKKSHSHNITMSDWNSLVDYCEHLLKDVALTVQVLKDISNSGALIDAVNTAEIVYGTGADGAYKEYRVDSDTNGWTQSNNLVRRDVYGGIRVAVPDSGYVDNYAANVEWVRLAKQEAINYAKNLRLAIDDAYKLTLTDVDGKTLGDAIDLPLEDLIVNIDDVEENGTRYLQLTLRNGNITKIELDNIFEGFVKSRANAGFKNSVYGIGNIGNEVLYSTDKAIFPDIAFNTVALRKLDGDIYLPNPSNTATSAARVDQVYEALDRAINYTNVGLEYFTTMFEDSINAVRDRLDQLESTTLKYTEFSGVTDAVQVPANSARYAIIEKIGGMTHKVVGDNLWDTKSTVTSENGITVNEDGSITLNGTFDDYYISIPSVGGGCLSLGTTELDDEYSRPYAIVNMSMYREEDDFWDEANASFENGACQLPSGYDASLVLNGTFNNITIYPMLVDGNEPKPYKPYSKILLSTDVTSIRSEEANGALVDSITIPDAVKDKLHEHFEFGDGIDKTNYNFIDEENCNYLDTLTETVHGNVARMVLDGSELDASGNSAWRIKTSSSTKVTRLQINYTNPSADLRYPIAWAFDTDIATPALCNAYKSVPAVLNNKGTEGIAFSTSTFFVHDPNFTLKHFDSEADILGAWKAHLKNNPLTVIYKVATPVVENVSDIISDAFNRVAVRSLGKVKPMSDSSMAATMTVAFVEAKGAE